MIRILGRLWAAGACAVALSGCSCEDADDNDDSAAGADTGSAATGGSSTGGARQTGGTGGTRQTGGTGGGTTLPEGATGGLSLTGGTGATGGDSNLPAAGAGGLSNGGSNDSGGGTGGISGSGGGAISMAGSSGSAGAGVGGRGAAGAGSDAAGGLGGELGGGAGGASPSCDALCSTGTCVSTQPACLAEAYGLTEGDVIPICVPQGSASGLTYCETTTCGTGAGCALSVHVGTVDWNLDGAPSAVILNVTVTQMDGAISVAAPSATCDLTLDIPARAPLPVVANGTLDGQDTLGLSSTETTVDTSGATLSSAPTSATCSTVATLALGAAESQINEALRSALNSMADPLTCLECRADCPQGVACVSQ